MTELSQQMVSDSISAQEWARRQLEGTVLAHLRLGSRKRVGIQAVYGTDRWVAVCGVPDEIRRETIALAIAKSPHRDSPEAQNVRNRFLGVKHE
jgi:hypothetical protein